MWPTRTSMLRLWDPLRQYLGDRGVRVHLGAQVRRVTPGSTKAFGVLTESRERFEADAVVLALDVDGLRRVVAASPGLGDDQWRTRIAELRTAPPFVVDRLWLDRPVDRNRPAFFGTSGHQPLDNISVPERYEQEAAAWARLHGGSVVELHSYATTSEWSGGQAIAQLHKLYPETATAGVVYERVLLRSDCPLFVPGTYTRRPTVADAAAWAGTGRRRDPHRPAGGADGTRGHHRLLGRQSLADVVAAGRPRVVHRSHPRPVGAAAFTGRPPRAAPAMSVGDRLSRRWPKDWPVGDDPACLLDAAAPDLPRRAARRSSTPRWIGPNADRPGNWYVFGASSDVRVGRAFGARVAGVELVAWRDKHHRLRVGPRSCPHLGADLATGVVRGGVLYCRWHGLAFDGDTCALRLAAVSQPRRRRPGLGAPGLRRRGGTPGRAGDRAPGPPVTP